METASAKRQSTRKMQVSQRTGQEIQEQAPSDSSDDEIGTTTIQAIKILVLLAGDGSDGKLMASLNSFQRRYTAKEITRRNQTLITSFLMPMEACRKFNRSW